MTLAETLASVGRLATVVVLTATCAQAQASPTSPPQPGASGPRWSGGFGYEALWFRDISGTGRPMAASPVTWEGTGPAFSARVQWLGEDRVQQLAVAGGVATGFRYGTPLGYLETAGDESATRVEGRYEYRRYPFRDVLVDGLDFGFGLEALGGRTSFTRRVAPATSAHDVRFNAGGAGVVAARFRRDPAVGLEVLWTNGLIIGWRSEDWQGGSSISHSGGGGGWLSRLHLEGDARLLSSVRLFVRYGTEGEGFLSTHRAYTVGRRTISVGLIYAR